MTESTPRPVRVLVCGERLRGDDAAGPIAAEMLPADVRALADIVEVGQLLVEDIIDMPAGVAVIVADAATGVVAGTVVTRPLADVARPGGPVPSSSHALPADQVIALAAELRGEMPRGVFVGIGAATFDFGAELSPAVRSGMGAYVEALAAAVRELAAGRP